MNPRHSAAQQAGLGGTQVFGGTIENQRIADAQLHLGLR